MVAKLTEKAREAAEAWFSGDPLCQDAKLGYEAGHDAGVREGIRRAREAVETVPVTQSRNAALAAIDALEVEK